VVGDVEQFDLTITPFNRLPASGDGGKLLVVVPSEMTLSSASCTATASGSTLDTCSISSNTITVEHASEISSGTDITIEVSDSITMPKSALPTTSGFACTTYYGSYEVDSEESAVVAADTANEITSATIGRDDAIASSGVVFTVAWTSTNPLPSNSGDGRAKIYIPQENLDSGSNPASAAAVSMADSGAMTVLSIDDGTDYFMIEFESSCSSECSSVSGMTISGFTNAGTAIAPSNSWKIETYFYETGTTTNWAIDSISTGVICTPYIKSGNVGITESDISRDSDTVADTVALTLPFTPDTDI
jgi:hypothetical protein